MARTSRGKKRNRNGYAGTGKTLNQLERELEQRIGRQAATNASHRHRQRWAEQDATVHTTTHKLDCAALNSTGACNCT